MYDSKFSIRSINSRLLIPFSEFVFPGGEIQVRIDPMYVLPSDEFVIEAYITNARGIMTLVLLTDALRAAGASKIRLTLPYLPYARQDRVCVPGEAFALQRFARIINSMVYASVVCTDVHSPVANTQIDRLISYPRSTLLLDYVNTLREQVYIVCPDKGAVLKTEQDIKQLGSLCKGIVYIDKVRDPNTGKLIKFERKTTLPRDAKESKFLIVDDICDGGGTFIGISEIMRKDVGELALWVTHGIFSKGVKPLLDHFDEVHAEYDWHNEFTPQTYTLE